MLGKASAPSVLRTGHSQATNPKSLILEVAMQSLLRLFRIEQGDSPHYFGSFDGLSTRILHFLKNPLNGTD